MVTICPLQDTLKKLLMDSLEVPFNEANDGTWSAVRELLHHQTELAVSQYSSALSSFELDEKVMRMLITNLRDSARCTVEAKARAKAGTVLISMKKRYQLCLEFGIKFFMLLMIFNVCTGSWRF